MNLRRSNLFDFISSIFNRWNFPVGKVDDFSYYIGMFWEGFKQPLKLYSLFNARTLARTCYLASSKMAFDSIHISIYPLIQCLNQLTIPFFEQCQFVICNFPRVIKWLNRCMRRGIIDLKQYTYALVCVNSRKSYPKCKHYNHTIVLVHKWKPSHYEQNSAAICFSFSQYE